MKPLFFILATLIYLFSNAQPDLNVQTDEIAQINELENIVRQFNYTRNISPKELHIEGSAYLDKQFVDGIVSLTTGAVYQKIPLRLNAFNEEIEFRNPAGKIFNINNPESIRELMIGDKKFIYTDIHSNNENKKVLVEVIEEGDISLLKHHRIRLTEGREAQTHRPAQPPKLVKGPAEYLVRKADRGAEHVRNEKDLLKILPEKKEKIKEILNQQKLSVKEEKDLSRLIKQLNE